MPKVGKGKCWRGQSPALKLLVSPGWKSQYDWGICLGIGKKQEKMDFCCCLVTKLYLTLWDPMNGTPCFSVHQYLPEFAQTHVHWVSDAIQPAYPLSSFSCPQSFPASGSFSVSQPFASGGQSIGAQLQHQSSQYNIHGWFPLHLTGLISLLSKGLSRVFSPAPQFKSISSLALSLLYQMAKVLLNTQTSVLAVLFILEQGVK